MNHAVANFIACFMHLIRILKSIEQVEIHVLEYELCTTWGVLLCLVCCVTMFTNALIAINRALACYPQRGISQMLRSRCAALVAITSTWIFFFGLAILPVVIDLESFNAFFYCLYDPMEKFYINITFRDSVIMSAQNFLRVALGLSGITTFLICFILYATILHFLFCNNHHRGSVSKQRRKEKLRALIMIVVVFIMLACCWVPPVVVMVWKPELLAKHDLLFWLPMLDAAVVPFIYTISMPEFRPSCQLTGRKSAS